MAVLQLTEEQFETQYRPIPNHIDPNAGWNFGTDQGCLFETFGAEFEFVRQYDPQKIWTLIDADEGRDMYIVSGRHHVNRVGYILTENPVAIEDFIEVRIPFEEG